MQKHTKIYLKHFGYDESSWIKCEICPDTATDIHHIDARGMGGSREKDKIENLMALCRSCHNKYGDIKDLKPYLHKIHNLRLNAHAEENKVA